MPFTNSETDLSDRLFNARASQLNSLDEDTRNVAEERLREICDADAEAIVGWLLANSSNSVVAKVTTKGIVAAAIPVTIPGAPPLLGATTATGTSTSEGDVITSSLQ